MVFNFFFYFSFNLSFALCYGVSTSGQVDGNVNIIPVLDKYLTYSFVSLSN